LARSELDRAYRLAGLVLGTGADAEEAVGDALERAVRSIHGLRDDRLFRAWFDRILVNACRDRLRRRRLVRFVPIDAVSHRSSDRDAFATIIDSDDLLRAVGQLPPDDRITVVLRFWADLEVNEIAARTGVPAGTVKSRLHRALERLRQGVARP